MHIFLSKIYLCFIICTLFNNHIFSLYFSFMSILCNTVVFQNNPITGLFILIGLFVQSPRVAVHGVIGTTSGTIIAYLLGFEKGLTRSGLFGYNSVLCGLAISTFNNPDEDRYRGYSVAIIISTVVFSCFSSILFVFMGKLLIPYKVTPLTLPFNVSVIIYLLATVNMSRVETAIVGAQIGNGADLDLEVDVTITIQGFFAGCIRGCGQIFLADNIVSGALVLTGIALCSRISAMGALFGSTIGATVAVLIGVPGVQVESGLFGFNSCLTVIAMYMFYTPSQTVFIVSILAASMTVIVQQSLTTLLQPYGIPFMTLPFCFAALPFIVIQGTSSLIAVPLSSITVPEDHLKKVRCLHEGFYFLKEALYPDNARDFLQKNSQDIRITNDLDKTKHARFNLSNVSEEDTLENDTLENDTKATYEAASDFGLSKQRFNTSNILSRKKIICNKFQRNDPKWVLDAAPKIFEAIDSAESRSISIEALQYVLQQNGLHSKSGTRFITLVIRIMVSIRFPLSHH
jgi:urea transporter